MAEKSTKAVRYFHPCTKLRPRSISALILLNRFGARTPSRKNASGTFTRVFDCWSYGFTEIMPGDSAKVQTGAPRHSK
ncbi:MAG: hypothetical protein ACRES5_05400, partial [Pseudomonas sp.]